MSNKINHLGYQVKVVRNPNAFREEVKLAVAKRGVRSHIEFIADTADAFKGWKLADGNSIGCLFVTLYENNVFYDRTIGMSAWRFLRQDFGLDIGLIPIDMNASDATIRRKWTTEAVSTYFRDWLKASYGWERMTRREQRRHKRDLFDIHRQAVANPVPPDLSTRIWERIMDIDAGTYSGELSTMDAQMWRRARK